MATVHTAYGPGKIVDQETVRGRTQYKVAGDGFEVWLDETKIAAYTPGGGVDLNSPHWDGYDLGDKLNGDAFGGTEYGAPSDDDVAEYQDPRGQLNRGRMRTHDDYDGYGDEDASYRHSRLAWAPMDHDNSTSLPYNPDPQHQAVGFSGDDGSATLQPIHHIDADERLHSSDSLTFEDEDEGEEPGPNPDLFAKEGAIPLTPGIVDMARPILKKYMDEDRVDDLIGGAEGAAAGKAVNHINRQVDGLVNAISPGAGWGDLIKPASVHEANPALALLPAVLRAVAPSVASGLLGGGSEGSEGGPDVDDFGPGEGWGDLVKDGSYRPSGLSDRYIDITAGADYHNDPVAQFRHDPDAYINRIGHLMDEGLNPRFAEYMDLVEADNNVRTAAWKDVRKKAMRLKREGHVTVKDIAPNRIMASVVGDHGTYDVLILKGSSFGGLDTGGSSHSIANWHCACEWGKWAFRRKFSYVGRLCSHGYAAYLTMQSAHMTGKPRRTKQPTKAPKQDRSLTFPYIKGSLRHADALQDGPKRLVPELVINDADDAHIFLDVTKDERDDTGPDDVVSDKDIVHFARVMAECERTERPYPRHLVSFLARYAGCNDDSSDDTQADYKAHDATDANEYLEELRSDADRKQEKDFGSMADRVHRIQDTVEEARAHGADASQFVAAVRKIADPISDLLDREFDPTTGRDKVKSTGKPAPSGSSGGDPISNALDREFDPATGRDKVKSTGKPVQEDTFRDWAGLNSEFDPATGRDKPKPGTEDKVDNSNNGATDQSPGVDGTGTGNIKDIPKGNSGHGGYADKARQEQMFPSNNKGPEKQNTPPANAVGTNGKPAVAPKPGVDNAGVGAGGAGGGMTSGTISDGGVAGAENGNNAAITKTSPGVDADGNYTVGKGDTWSDIAQRTTGDMNNYQKMFDQQKGGAGSNIDSLAEGTKINVKDYLTDTGNNGVKGDVTNPSDGGADKNISTLDTPAAPAINPNTQADNEGVGTLNLPDLPAPAQAPAAPPPGETTPKPAGPPVSPASLRRRAAPTNSTTTSDSTAGEAGETNTTAPTTNTLAKPGAGTATTPAVPGATTPTAPTTAQPGGTNSALGTDPDKESDTYDPNDPTQTQQQQGTGADRNGGGMAENPSMTGMGGMDALSGLGDIASGIGGALPDLASGAMSAAPAIASGVGDLASGLMSGLGGILGSKSASSSIFSNRQDFDDWARYAYPAGGGDDFDPESLPHVPFNGSGNPGPLDFGTSEEYADKARKKMDDVTDLGDDPLSTPMGDWQRQGSYEGSTDDSSDIVAAFQRNAANTALGAGAGGDGGRFDDLAGAAQGFLRTAGRNYSMAEQSELIREGDKGGARNLNSLDLRGTHYEDMDSLGW